MQRGHGVGLVGDPAVLVDDHGIVGKLMAPGFAIAEGDRIDWCVIRGNSARGASGAGDACTAPCAPSKAIPGSLPQRRPRIAFSCAAGQPADGLPKRYVHLVIAVASIGDQARVLDFVRQLSHPLQMRLPGRRVPKAEESIDDG